MPAKRAFDHYFRFANVDVDSADDDDKTIQVAFSSETPVLRTAREGDEKLGIAKKGEKYWEVLSHDKRHADFSQLDGGKGAVLLEHKDELEIGTVKRAKISKDKVGRAVLKFDGLTELSNATYARMKDGTRPGISTGYWHTGLVSEGESKDGYPTKIVSWAADEITSTRKPADEDKTGVARSMMFRSAEGKWACLTCGELFTRAELDEDYECGCQDSRSTKEQKLMRAKTEDGETRISHQEMRDKVNSALYNDKRFKSHASNGDTRADFNLHDIHQIVNEDGEDDWEAIVSSPAYSGQYHCVGFDCDEDGNVELGDSYEVEPKSTFEAIERGLTSDGRLIRGGKLDYEYADQENGRFPISTPEQVCASFAELQRYIQANDA